MRIKPKRPLIWICILLLIASLMASVPRSSLDFLFDEKQVGEATGRIDDIVCKDGKMTLTLSEVSFQKEGDTNPYILNQILVYTKENDVYLGNRILVKGILSKFQPPSNPGEFNSYYYYNSKGISYRMMEADVTVLDAKKDWLKVCLQMGRTSIEKVYKTWLFEEQAATLSAMFLGDKTQLSNDIKREYQKNGMGHLLAISGLHVSLIAMGIYQVLLSTLKRKKAAALIAMITAVLYGIMTGFSISTNRAVIMILISFAAILMGRTYDMLSATALSASIILAFHPLELRNSGFLLSYGSIFGIAFIYPLLKESFLTIFETLQKEKKLETISVSKNKCVMNKWLKGICSSLLMSISIQLITFPILLNSFYEYPLYGILINLIVIPLMSVLAVLSVGAGILGMIWSKLAVIFVGGIFVILKIYEGITNFFLKFPFATIITGKPQTSFFILYYTILAGTLILWHFTKKKRVWMLLFLLIAIPILPKNPGMKVTFLDVGQGDSIYIETKDGINILVDGGSSTKAKVGQYILEPFLKSQGCKKLDYVFITHLDQDHYNGILELVEFTDFGGVAIDTVVLGAGIEKDDAYFELVELLTKHNIKLKYINRNEDLKKGQFYLHCINPDSTKETDDKNDNSIGLEVSYGKFSILLTGDMEESETDAMQYLTSDKYQILKVGHHGSKSSSNPAFLERIAPTYSFISCGLKNRYGHPHKETLERLKAVKSDIFISSVVGAVCVQTNGKKYVIDTFKHTF